MHHSEASAVDEKHHFLYLSTTISSFNVTRFICYGPHLTGLQILDKDPQLHFSLLRLQLVELIRQCNGGDINPALDFATRKLAPRAAVNQDFLKDLEKTMALLIFPHDSLAPESEALLRSDLRPNSATKVNEAIHERQS